ncbi:MAG: 4-oxalocrotonate tautomerase [Proteobacteria bacterium]|nr:MAG: 4-oxalocrotonate tautomerase [Pseudomonadota bacterium]
MRPCAPDRSRAEEAAARPITDLMVEVEGQGSRDFRRNVRVRIEEQEPSHRSLGGMQPTSEIIASTFNATGATGVRVAR